MRGFVEGAIVQVDYDNGRLYGERNLVIWFVGLGIGMGMAKIDT